MLITQIPLFDENMIVTAYSMYTQKKNFLLNPSLLGSGKNDGAVDILGLEIIEKMGINVMANEKEIFVEVNNISIFTDITGQCHAPREQIVLLFDNTITPIGTYIKRVTELKEDGFKLAIRKLKIEQFEEYKEILLCMDYIFLDHKKINIDVAKIYFQKVYPNIKLIASNIKTQEIFEELKNSGGYQLYEGEFFRTPITKGEHKVAPLKVNYIELLNMVNNPNFELTEAADVIGRDTALVISLLKMVNRRAINSEITSIRHATAMLGQKELKTWINTAVTKELYSDKPNEITRVSLIRAKFAEKLAPAFEMASRDSEVFLMGLFSVLDVILNMSMKEALKMVNVSKDISDALVDQNGKFAPLLHFMLQYETGNWQEVSRIMILENISIDQVYSAYIHTLQWYREIFMDK